MESAVGSTTQLSVSASGTIVCEYPTGDARRPSSASEFVTSGTATEGPVVVRWNHFGSKSRRGTEVAAIDSDAPPGESDFCLDRSAE